MSHAQMDVVVRPFQFKNPTPYIRYAISPPCVQSQARDSEIPYSASWLGSGHELLTKVMALYVDVNQGHTQWLQVSRYACLISLNNTNPCKLRSRMSVILDSRQQYPCKELTLVLQKETRMGDMKNS